jgi:hypothetical protein
MSALRTPPTRGTKRSLMVWILIASCEEIADRHAERNPELESLPTGDAVSKAIRRAAAALQLV